MESIALTYRAHHARGTLIFDGPVGRAVVGAAAAVLVALVARRAGWLTARGGAVAVATGTAAAVAGWGWAALLVAYFVALSALTRIGRAEKAARGASTLPTDTARSGRQVAANGSVFALGALASYAGGSPVEPWAAIAALGALAASAADTAATETGMLWGGTPRALVGWAEVAPGTSGGVTVVGLVGAAAGALAVGGAAIALLHGLGVSSSVALGAVAAGGFAGSLGDSVLGATLQARRACERCGARTERTVHDCGGATRHAGGARWVTNDVVNLWATLVGAGVAVATAAAVAAIRS